MSINIIKRKAVWDFNSKDHHDLVAKFKAHELDDLLNKPKKFFDTNTYYNEKYQYTKFKDAWYKAKSQSAITVDGKKSRCCLRCEHMNGASTVPLHSR